MKSSSQLYCVFGRTWTTFVPLQDYQNQDSGYVCKFQAQLLKVHKVSVLVVSSAKAAKGFLKKLGTLCVVPKLLDPLGNLACVSLPA